MPNLSGFGCSHFDIAVYISNIPPMDEYRDLGRIYPLAKGEIKSIGQVCGNGWRKVFNVYAKLLFALDKTVFNYSEHPVTWQEFRDNWLLQEKSYTALFFSMPNMDSINTAIQSGKIHILCGRTYAKVIIDKLTKEEPNFSMSWLDEEFAVNEQYKIVVCPYFDYRQLSNRKIERLMEILKSLKR